MKEVREFKRLKNLKPLFLVFISYGHGVHFNTVFRGTEPLERLLDTHCRTNKIPKEKDEALRKVDLWASSIGKKGSYTDLWVGFSDKTWLTISYNPHVQDVYQMAESSLRQSARGGLIQKGVPKWVRVYDFLHPRRAKERPKDTKYRYTVVFTGAYRKIRMNRKVDPGPYWCLRSAENPADYCVMEPHNRPVDYIYSPSPPTLGLSNSIMGKRIRFEELPVAVKLRAVDEYRKLWDLSGIPQPIKKLPETTARMNATRAAMQVIITRETEERRRAKQNE